MSSPLDELTAQVGRDLRLLSYPQREWVAPRTTSQGEPIHDVVIVGGGQGGLAAAFGLLRERVKNVLVIDENAEGMAGPWLRFARMRTLRTPKYLTGPDLGIPSLTPRAWYEARHGASSWDQLSFLPKELWAEYLIWYRTTLNIPVEFDTRVGPLRFSEADAAFEVPCTRDGREFLRHARRVVLATGIEGSGDWHVPRMIAEALPASRYAHTRWDIDFQALRDKRVAVLGAGASAFDNAATALEHGAREVRLYFRRERLVDVNPYRWAEFVGFLAHLGDLPDADKWKYILQILRMGQLPPRDTLERAARSRSFHLQPGAAWKSVSLHDDAIVIETSGGTFEADFIIVGTGFVTDLRMRPELALIEPQIARWVDRFSPPADERHEDLARHPYLGPSFEFTERTPGTAPWLRHVYNYTFGCLPSLGFGGASISGMKYSIPRLVSGITRSFFVEDHARYYQSLLDFSDREF